MICKGQSRGSQGLRLAALGLHHAEILRPWSGRANSTFVLNTTTQMAMQNTLFTIVERLERPMYDILTGSKSRPAYRDSMVSFCITALAPLSRQCFRSPWKVTISGISGWAGAKTFDLRDIRVALSFLLFGRASCHVNRTLFLTSITPSPLRK